MQKHFGLLSLGPGLRISASIYASEMHELALHLESGANCHAPPVTAPPLLYCEPCSGAQTGLQYYS